LHNKIHSLHAYYAIAGEDPMQNIFRTCSHSSHAFRKRVWILPVGQKMVEMTT